MARRFLITPLLGLLLAAAFALSVAGHGNGAPWIWVEDQVVQPGEPFYTLVIDFQPHQPVQLEVRTEALSVAVGSVVAEADGHGEIDLTIPADFPHGYAELHGRSPDGTEGTALLVVGGESGAIGPPAPTRPPPSGGPAAGATELWQDPSVITLAGLLGATALVLVWVALQRRSGAQAQKMPPKAATRGRRAQ